MAETTGLFLILGTILVGQSLAYTFGNETRRNSIPVLYARGTHYEVGYTAGRTFKSMIAEYIKSCTYIDDVLMPAYKTKEGKAIYKQYVQLVQDAYPKYMEELRGISEGSDVSFAKLFLLHIDNMMSNNVQLKDVPADSPPVGCSTILCNHPGQVIIGHNEDSFAAVLNHAYILHADIEEETENGREIVESFSSVCYAGELPGYTMGFNKHGVVFTINIIEPEKNPLGMMPRHFVGREMLSAKNMDEVKEIIKKGGGVGVGDGMSVNAGIWKPDNGETLELYNIEMGPGTKEESAMNVSTIQRGETLLHTNKYLHLENIPEKRGPIWQSSVHREDRYKKDLPPANDERSVRNVLGDNGDKEFPFHRDGKAPDTGIVTVVTGIFDFLKGTWSLYVENPASDAPPVCVQSMSMLK